MSPPIQSHRSDFPRTDLDAFARLAFAHAGVGITVTSREGLLLHANDAFGRMLGIDAAALIGTAHPGFDQLCHALALKPATWPPSQGEVELSYARADGTRVWALETIATTRAPDGTECLVSIVHDISREKTVEQDARKFKFLSDETSEALLLINRQGIVVYANNAAALLAGLSRDALQRGNIARICPELAGPEYDRLFERAGRGRVPGVRLTLQPPKGERREVEATLFVSEFGGERLLAALIGDRADQQEVREALRDTEARLRIVVDLAQLSVYGWDPATGALSWDARLKAMWGLPPDAHVDFDVFWSGIHPEDRDLVDGALKRTLDPADGAYLAEFRVIGLTDKVERWVLACGQTFFKDGKPVGYIGAAMDTTARKRNEVALEQTVAERTAELREVVAELEAFSYSISHDLRAPLRAIQGFAQILEEDCGPQVSATGKEYIRRIVTAADRMDRLIQDALTYSRLARRELPLENVDLAALVNGLLEGYPQFQRPHAEVSVVFPLPRVRANVAALTQCLSNLLGNAVKFVAPGRVPMVKLWAELSGTRVKIYVRDNGIGIDPAVHGKIFDLFYRLDPKRDGTGIGLTVVRRAAERMNGRVTLESKPGEGSTFILELDAATWA